MTFDPTSLAGVMRALMATDKIGLHSSLVFFRRKCERAYREGGLLLPASPANVLYEMLAASEDAMPLFAISDAELIEKARAWERERLPAGFAE